MAGGKKASKGKSKKGEKKKKESSKDRKSSKKSTDSKKPVVEDETNTKMGDGKFKFLNRDEYEGSFKITKVPVNYICRKGVGTYKTADGQTYIGEWDADVLRGGVVIQYKDGGKYIGPIEDMKYMGYARYEFPDASATTSNFVADRPVGEMVLVDPAGKLTRDKNVWREGLFESKLGQNLHLRIKL